MIEEDSPLPRLEAWSAVGRCVVASAGLLARHAVVAPRERVGETIGFADGTVARVYRESVVRDAVPRAPAVLVVGFRLRGVHGRGHAWFRRESPLNTPLFVGFPGFVSKLWLTHDAHEVYRGLYQWDGAAEADAYARALWHVLALVCVPGTIRHHVVPGWRRDDAVRRPDGLPVSAASQGTADDGWWRPVAPVADRSGSAR